MPSSQRTVNSGFRALEDVWAQELQPQLGGSDSGRPAPSRGPLSLAHKHRHHRLL